MFSRWEAAPPLSFAIGDNVYAVPAVQTLRSYTLSRCGSPIDDDITGLKVKMGHPQDKEAQVYFTDKLNKKGDKGDVTGGWYDAGYARQLQKEADKIWAYLGKTKESVYRVDEGQESGSGPYNDDNDIQERLWMAAEMFRTTGDKKYENYLAANRAELLKAPGFFTWDNTLALAQFAYAMSKGADSSLQAQVKKVYLDYADLISDKISKDGFGCALSQDEYTWASTKNAMTQGDMLLMAYQLDQKPAYLEGALAQIHYMFGRNSLDKSFLTGAGANPPEHPHNKPTKFFLEPADFGWFFLICVAGATYTFVFR